MSRLSDREFRLWVSMITQCDDEGRLVADPGQLGWTVFGAHFNLEVTEEIVQDSLLSLSKTGLIRVYRVDDVQYVDYPSWNDHQRVDHPTPSVLPAYEDSRKLDSSRETSRTLAPDLDRTGTGKLLSLSSVPASKPTNVVLLQGDVQKFWEAYPPRGRVRSSQKTVKAAWTDLRPTPELAAKILAGLEAAKKSRDWTKEAGQFVPAAHRWLKNHGWEGHEAPQGSRASTTDEYGVRTMLLR